MLNERHISSLYLFIANKNVIHIKSLNWKLVAGSRKQEAAGSNN